MSYLSEPFRLGVAMGWSICQWRCHRQYTYEPFRLRSVEVAAQVLRRCRREYLSEPFRLCLPPNDERRERFTLWAAPWRATASRYGQQPERLRQIEYGDHPKSCTRTCIISIRAFPLFLISMSFAIFNSFCKDSQLSNAVADGELLNVEFVEFGISYF